MALQRRACLYSLGNSHAALWNSLFVMWPGGFKVASAVCALVDSLYGTPPLWGYMTQRGYAAPIDVGARHTPAKSSVYVLLTL
jgi:hypothetical protein